MLVDNGSLRPAATLALRELAAEVSARSGVPVRPVSLLHSSKIDPAELGGVRAEVVPRWLRQRCEAGQRRFGILPLFLGPTGALTDYVPQKVAALAERFEGLEVKVAPVLAADAAGEAVLARMLADGVEETAREAGLSAARVVLCDHGSPQREVAAVRDRVAARLGEVLRAREGFAVQGEVVAASMERREGEEYAFNEPLLERALREIGLGEVIVANFFLLPGRHAGVGGDVATIIDEAVAARPGLRVWRMGLLGGHPALVELLVERLRQGMSPHA